MHTLLISGLVAGASALGKMLIQRNESRRDGWVSGIKVIDSERIALPREMAERIVANCYTQLGFTCIDHESGVFHRGNDSITELPTSRRVGWCEIPIAASSAYKPARDRTEVHLIFISGLRLLLSPEIAEFFRKEAKDECDRIFRHLRRIAREFEKEARDAEHREHRQRASAQAQEAERSTGADLAALGLAIGASWTQVQAAFRECCKKYHPDHLNGQNVAPHLVELALQRFKDISDAYQRLKGRMT